jgi:hypothetical protein
LILPPRSASTWAALVALILPEVLALGAASGCPNARISSPANPFGTRMPTVSRPAVASAWMPLSVFSGTTIVSGPGQKASASARYRIEIGIVLGHRKVRHVADQRIELRPALGLVDPCDRRRIGGIGGKAVDGLGRDGDRQTVAQHLTGSLDCLLLVGSDVDDLCHGLPGYPVRQSLCLPGASINIGAFGLPDRSSSLIPIRSLSNDPIRAGE